MFPALPLLWFCFPPTDCPRTGEWLKPSLKKLDIHSDFGAPSDDIASHTDPLRLVSDAAAWLEGPEEKLEFLAKKLVEGSLDSKHVLLGSPIYVAYADRHLVSNKFPGNGRCINL